MKDQGYWVLEYRHRHGTDVILCEDEQSAKITALHCFLEAWTEIPETQELIDKVEELCKKIVAHDVDGAMSALTDICVDDKYNYDESFFWSYHGVSDADKTTETVIDAATQTVDLIEERKKEDTDG